MPLSSYHHPLSPTPPHPLSRLTRDQTYAVRRSPSRAHSGIACHDTKSRHSYRYSHISDLVRLPSDLQISSVTLGPSFIGFSHSRIPSDLSGSSSDLSDSSLILEIGSSSEILRIILGDPPPPLPTISADAYAASLSSTILLFRFLVITLIYPNQ